MKHNYNKIGFHSLSLNVTLWILCVLMTACGSGGGSGSEGGVGSISFDFVLATPQRSGVVAGQQPNQAEFPCEENEVETIEAQVFDENEVLLAEGGPWPCADGEGVISDVEAGDNRIVKIFARNSEGDIVFAGRSEPFSVQAGETTRVGTIELVIASLIPVTNEDTAITDEDQDVTIAVIDNDSDPYYNPSGDYFGTLDPTTVAVVSNPTSGNTEVNADGTVRYMPDGNSNGADSFTYAVQDDFGATSNETLVTVTVNPVNDPPVANDQAIVTDEDSAVGITATGSDVDVGDTLTFSVVGGPAHGSLNGTAPNLTYTPDANYHGADSFTFKANDGSADSNVATVTITVIAVNDPPVANDQADVTDEENAVGITVTGSDVDVGDTLTFSVVGGPAHGSLSGTAPNLIYMPDANYHGADSFTFKASDGSADSNVATVTITVIAVNDPPVADDQAVVTVEDDAVGITVTGSDVDVGDTLTFSVVGGPAHGSLSGTAPNLIYMPDANYHGADSFTFKASDGSADSNVATVTITVIAVNDPPVANDQADVTDEDDAVGITVTGSDVDVGDTLTFSVVGGPAHGSLSGTAPNLIYTPDANYHGADSFTFKANDGSADSNVATVTITVIAVNDPPVADDDPFDDIQVFSVVNALDVLANDSDPVEGDPLIITAVDTPTSQGGLVTINRTDDGLLYTPVSGFFGTDTFTYTITDVPGGSLTPLPDTALVTVNVTATITRVSVATGDVEANDNSFNPSISADGLIVAFESTATDLVTGDTNDQNDIFVHNRQTGTTERVSVDSGGGQANDSSFNPSISADGLIVAFDSNATDLVTGDDNFESDIFAHNRSNGSTVRVSVDSGGGEANGSSFNPSISADGLFVAFDSTATDLVVGDNNNDSDIFVHNRSNGSTMRASVDSNGNEATNGDSFDPSISSDGRFVAFESNATNLEPPDSGDFRDIFVHDRDTDEDGIFDQPGAISTQRVSNAAGGGEANGSSFNPSINADGLLVAFESTASDLVASDTNNASDIFVNNRSNGTTTRVSVATGGGQANGSSSNPSISADGRFVAFESNATNLVIPNNGDLWDIFVHDRQTGETERISDNADGIVANGESFNPSINSNGRFVAFDSDANNLVTGDGNISSDVFEAPNFLAP